MLVPYARASLTWKVPYVAPVSMFYEKTGADTDSLSGQTLAQHFRVLVDEEVLDRVLVTLSDRRLSEGPTA